jgi:hypothetical protein
MKRLILILLLISFESFAQTKPTKKELIKLFKNSIEQEEKNTVTTKSNPWIINNLNGEYYSLDTLKVYSYNNKRENEFCEYIGWTLYKKDSFILNKVHHCNEPTQISATKKEDWFKIIFIENKDELILELYNFEILINKFKVLSINKNNTETELTLKRI